jgi:uncharacterized protein YlxW (UPF0749 family)
VIAMYSNARNMSLFAVILGAFNILTAIVLAFVYLKDFKMGWTFEFAAMIYLLSGAVAMMLLSAGLRSATTDLSANEDSTQEQIRALKKRVEELENKVKYQ